MFYRKISPVMGLDQGIRPETGRKEEGRIEKECCRDIISCNKINAGKY